MLSEILQQIKDQFIRAKYQKKHPFRYFVLTTTEESGSPRARTVVLRHFDPQEMTLTIYTDQRSQKVKALTQHKEACMLFYDPKKLWQIQVMTRLIQQSGDSKIFQSLPPPAQKDYTTQQAPGSVIANPDAVTYLNGQHFFMALTFKILSIESLKLKRPNHVRSLFELQNKWAGSYLNP